MLIIKNGYIQTKYEANWIIYMIMNFENKYIIDDMIYSHEIDKWVTIEEYYEIYYNSPLNIKLKEYKDYE